MSSTSEIDFPYPDNTPGSDFQNNGGKYIHNLTQQNRAVLNELKDWVKQDNINLNDLGGVVLDSSLLLLRYLRANNFDTKKAKKHILKSLEWRNAQGVNEILKLTPEEILGCKLSDLLENFPHWHCGYDKTGRPLLIKQQGSFEMKAVKALCGGDLEKVYKYHIWEQELISRVCYEQSVRTHTLVETITVVLDVKGLTMSSLTSDFRKLMSTMIKMDQDYYPETLGRILIVNAPSAFPMIWAVMKPWFDPITAAKVKILGSDFQAKLHEHVGAENLPANYFGTKPMLTKDMHPYAEAMALAGAGQGSAGNALKGDTTDRTETPTTSISESLGSLKISGDSAPVSVFNTAAPTSSTTAGEGSPAAAVFASGIATAKMDSPAKEESEPEVATGGFKQRAFIYDD
jgi:hypothetical protein